MVFFGVLVTADIATTSAEVARTGAMQYAVARVMEVTARVLPALAAKGIWPCVWRSSVSLG